MSATKDQTLMAAGLIAIYAFVIGFTDNYVRVIAAEAGLWQFHFTRSAMTAMLLGLGVAIWGFRIRPRNWRAVIARSAIHGSAMVIYFGALAFLDVALVAAGLFTAPIWVLLIARFAYGQPIGGLQVVAVALGFAGVILVLGPSAMAGASLPAILPILAGALYALGNIATREWCPEESAQTLLAGFFAALGVIGALGMIVLAIWPQTVASGADGFLMRGPVWPSGQFYFWTFVQAAGSLLGVGFMIRAYQITEASRASVLEYIILPASAFWTWVIWGTGLSWLAVLGMALIVAAGVLIATRRAPADSA
jgi:drug/metabolite transporter (DMT)-like permease